MKIAGGIYHERCVSPEWDYVFGSGGRAAAAISASLVDAELHTYCSDELFGDAAATVAAFGARLITAKADATVRFDYFHPLSNPRIDPPLSLIRKMPPLHVSGDVVLRFGFVEGTAVVDANRAIYDPQSGLAPEPFSQNGSTARHLAIVLNVAELLHLVPTESDTNAAALALMATEGAEVVVVKKGTQGATVYTSTREPVHIAAYRSETVFKIGSGDIFSAAFALQWGERERDAIEAAEIASRCVAWYCNSRTLPLPAADELSGLSALPIGRKSGRIYIAAPFFDIGQRWLVEEARSSLIALGVEVFSPLHEVGSGACSDVAPADLEGLEACSAVLAVANGGDPGTLFEIGYARARGMPVVVLAENVGPQDLTMSEGSGGLILRDFCSAIYHAVWASLK